MEAKSFPRRADHFEQSVTRITPPSEVSSSSPTPSTSSRITQQWPGPESLASIRESEPEVDANMKINTFAPIFENPAPSIRRRRDDFDDEEDDLLVTSGDLDDQQGGKVGLFDVVKREFRCKTAVITNRAQYEDPTIVVRKPKVNFIQDMKAKVSIAMEIKNKGMEELQAKEYRLATKYFHQALLYIKGLDPDEGVAWNPEFEMMDKDKMPLRVMPNELKEIKEAVEIDCYLNLAVCLMHKDRVPYKRIKEYCLHVVDIRDDHIKANMRAGMACYYLREYELSRFYLQTAKDFSHEPMDLNIKKYLHMVETQLLKSKKKK